MRVKRAGASQAALCRNWLLTSQPWMKSHVPKESKPVSVTRDLDGVCASTVPHAARAGLKGRIPGGERFVRYFRGFVQMVDVLENTAKAS